MVVVVHEKTAWCNHLIQGILSISFLLLDFTSNETIERE